MTTTDKIVELLGKSWKEPEEGWNLSNLFHKLPPGVEGTETDGEFKASLKVDRMLYAGIANDPIEASLNLVLSLAENGYFESQTNPRNEVPVPDPHVQIAEGTHPDDVVDTRPPTPDSEAVHQELPESV